MSKLKDMQRRRLYAAEHDSIWAKGKAFADTAEVQAYLDKLVGSAWFRRHFPKSGGRRISVVRDSRARRATAWEWKRTINLPPASWAWTEHMVLHEVAHQVTYDIHRRTVQGHGREYAANYVDLVQHKMGGTMAVDLKAAFAKHKVKFTRPRAKRVLTPEQKAALVERLAAARAAKEAKAA